MERGSVEREGSESRRGGTTLHARTLHAPPKQPGLGICFCTGAKLLAALPAASALFQNAFDFLVCRVEAEGLGELSQGARLVA